MRILIVEDDALVAFAIDNALSSAGHEIVGFARDEELALTLARSHQAEFALVDLKLARGSSGDRVARGLADLGVPSIFVSGHPDDCRRISAAAGALGCLPKPFSDRDLIESVAAAQRLICGERPQSLPAPLELYRLAG